MQQFTQDLKEFALAQGADLVGIAKAADLDEYFTPPHRPQDLMPNVKTIIVMALHIPDGSIEAQKREVTNYSYSIFGFTHLNKELDALTYRVTRYMEKGGYEALPIPGKGSHYWEQKKFYGPFSFRHAAVAAGLGEIGWSGLFLTPQYGSRQRLTVILTEASLITDPPFTGSVCTRCFDCIKNCPAGAIEKTEWNKTIGGRQLTYGVVDGDRCYWVARGLTTKAWPNAPFNPNVDVAKAEPMNAEEKFKALWEKRDARLRASEHDVDSYGATICGRCMAFCSAGSRAMQARLKRDI
ncbi:epoxyqueuosine reductase [Sporomusa sp. KB1]|uniref:epoxyqueuosine reductase n=1 Tax=Sporomusa sp. KB1 TaxID=943346 RepID=UPI0011AAF5B7|nr:epoxyqueuosine reductase [Sporomusa sp. KB1]TWH47223.1 hypothetical protein Salpa_3268 [Sporomusa sp. KB1]